jgi:hypothetical protein
LSQLACFASDSLQAKEFIYGEVRIALESEDLVGELLYFKFENGSWRMEYREAAGELGLRQQPRSFSIDPATGELRYVKQQGDTDSAVFVGRLTCDSLVGDYSPFSSLPAKRVSRKRVWSFVGIPE